MPRIKLELPERFMFTTELNVRISDINYGNHLGNDVVLALAHEARIQCLKQSGLSELDAGGCGMMMTEAAVVYKSQAFHGDVLKVEVAVTEPGRCGCNFVYRISNKATGKDVAHVTTGIVFFDYAAGKVARMPQKFATAFGCAAPA